jgi:hypothetical protein
MSTLSTATVESQPMKMVGKPDAGNPHVRFDEGGGPLARPYSTALQPHGMESLWGFAILGR